MGVLFLLVSCVLLIERGTCWQFVGEDESVIQWENFGNGMEEYRDCVYVVVGSGWGGVYSAWRLAREGIWKPSQICIFEAEKRVGGRALSLSHLGEDGSELGKLTLDLIAYRFNGAHYFVKSVVHDLDLETVCYFGVGNCQSDVESMYLLSNEYGNNVGYVTTIIGMLHELIQGGMPKVFGYHQLMETREEGKILRFKIRNSQDQKVVLQPKGDVFLNLPKEAVSALEGDFSSLSPESALSLALDSSVSPTRARQFAVYKNAFWVSMFDHCTSTFSDPDVNPPLAGRYDNGDVVAPCSTSTSNSSQNQGESEYINYCRVGREGVCTPNPQDAQGVLETFISPAEPYFENAVGDLDDVVVFGSKVHNHHFIDDIHQSLMEYYNLPPSSVDPPVLTAIVYLDSKRYPGISSIAFVETPDLFEVQNTVMNPFPSSRLFLANSAWGGISTWAEGSLQLVERILQKYFDLGPLPDIPGCYYNDVVCTRLGVENCDLPCSLEEELKWKEIRERVQREEAAGI